MSIQGTLHQAIRDATGTSNSYAGDWHALFNIEGIGGSAFNERMLAWLNRQTGVTYTNLSDAQHAFAVANGFTDWQAVSSIWSALIGSLYDFDFKSGKYAGASRTNFVRNNTMQGADTSNAVDTAADMAADLLRGVGDGASTAGWTATFGSVATVGGEIEVTRDATNARVLYPITCIVGAPYTISANIRRGTGTSVLLRLTPNADGAGATGSDSATLTGTTSAPLTHTFIATATTMYATLLVNGTTGQTGYFDHVRVHKARVANGTFDTDVAGWEAKFDGSISWSAGRLRVTANGGANAARAVQAVTGLTVGRTYLLTATGYNGTAGFNAVVGINSSGSISGALVNTGLAGLGSPGTFSFVATQTTHYIGFLLSVGAVGAYAEIDNVSVTEQSILLNGTFADTSAWLLKTPVGTETNTISGGTLNLTGDGGANAAYADQSFATVIGRSYTITGDYASSSAAVIVSTLQNAGTIHINTAASVGVGVTYTFTATTTTTWVRFSKSAAVLATVDNVVIADAGKHPTNMTTARAGGIGVLIVGLDTAAGVIDCRFFGNCTALGDNAVFFEPAAAIPSQNGQTWTASAELQIIAGTNTAVTQQWTAQLGDNAAGTTFPTMGAAAVDGTLRRLSATITISQANNAYIRPYHVMRTAAGVHDYTLRVKLPQAEQAYAATPAIRTSGSAVTVNDLLNTADSLFTCTRADGSGITGTKWIESANGTFTALAPNTMPRSDKGLLLEDARTNLFLNSGTPVTQSITVVNGTVYTASLVGSGSLTLSGAGTGVVTQGSPVTFTASTTSLTVTSSGSHIGAFVNAQVEAGAAASSPIRTTGTALQRAADVIYTTQLFAAGAFTGGYTTFVQAIQPAVPVPSGTYVTLANALSGATEGMELRYNSGASNIIHITRNAAAQSVTFPGWGTIPAAGRFKVAARQTAAGDSAIARPGFAVSGGLDTDNANPPLLSSLAVMRLGGLWAGSGGQPNTWVERVALWSSGLSNIDLAARVA